MEQQTMTKPVTTQVQQSCYVTSPPEVSSVTVVRLLQEREIRATTTATLVLGQFDQKDAAIAAADFFVAIVGRYGINRDIFFELGYAHALKKRLLIVVPFGAEDLPGSLAALPQVRTAPEDGEAIGFALDQLLAAPRHSNQIREVGTSSHPIDQDVAVQIRAEISATVSEERLATLIAKAIKASGIPVVEENRVNQSEKTIDLGVWADNFDSSIGNPLLIEIKRHLPNRATAAQAREQIEHYLHETSTRTALILYFSMPDELQDFIALSTTAVLFLPIDELITQLQTNSLSEKT